MAKAPTGIEVPKILRRCRSVNTFYPIEAGKVHKNTFEVEEKFQKLDNGVRFNVETLPSPKKKHKNRKELTRKDLFTTLQKNAASFYTDSFSEGNGGWDKNAQVEPNTVRLEAVSQTEGKLVYTGNDGFFQAAVYAFAQHLPLVISPDDIWTLISYAFAKHVDLHAEELRHHFVKHEGKKRIQIETGSGFVMSENGKPDTGATAEEWETAVFGQFSKAILEHIGDKVHGTVVAGFSTTTPAAKASSEITLMAATKHYFSYGFSTCCGIPEITLLGEEDDWISIVERVKALGKMMTKKFSQMWIPKVIPVLEQFVETFQGNVNYSFWQTMVKLRDTGGGSGSYRFISGWIQILFPYLSGGKLNTELRGWKKMYFKGPKPDEIPSIMSSVPVDWNYHGSKHDMHFHAGFVGFSQDNEGRLKSNIGWYVTHDPPKPIGLEISLIQNEIGALIQGNFKYGDKPNSYENKEWYKRVLVLLEKENQLLATLPKKQVETANQRIKYRRKLN